MRKNKTKEKLQAGETVFGTFIRNTDPALVEILGYLPWDFFVFDGEHGVLDPRDCENMVRAAELRDVTPLVRVTTNQPPTILRFMDSGAQGALVPWVNSQSDAEAAVRAIKYHPRGARGLAGVRAADYGQTGSLADYVQTANAETMVIVQIESAVAVEHIQEIVAVSDIDVIFIGPTDLSNSLGFPGQPQHPVVQAAIDRIIETVKPSQAAPGILVRDAAGARQWRERGMRFILTTLEAIMMPAVRDYLNTVRA